MKSILNLITVPKIAVAAAVLGLSGLAVKQQQDNTALRNDNAALQGRLDALVARLEQSQAAEEASRQKLMAQVRDLQNQLSAAKLALNQFSPQGTAAPKGDAFGKFPSDGVHKTVRWGNQ